jgi:hypothetical protein
MYDVATGVFMNALKWAIVIILLDLVLGTVILKYTDPIAFSTQHPYIVLLGTVGLFVFIRGIKNYKKLHPVKQQKVTIQLIDI